MEEEQSLDSFVIKAVEAGSNCILIGEIHNKCNILHAVIRTLEENDKLFSDMKVAIFVESYSALGVCHSSPYYAKDVKKA